MDIHLLGMNLKRCFGGSYIRISTRKEILYYCKPEHLLENAMKTKRS
jgi:hypothetical protein